MVTGLPVPYVGRRVVTGISTVLLYQFFLCVFTKQLHSSKYIGDLFDNEVMEQLQMDEDYGECDF